MLNLISEGPPGVYWLTLIIIYSIHFTGYSQEIAPLYSARGYWIELKKENYQTLKQKQLREDTLTILENQFLTDYEEYLERYFSHLSEEEKEKLKQLQDQWDKAIESGEVDGDQQFEWRGRDRILNASYGIWYGSSLLLITEPQSAAAAGVPLITGGLWLLGPMINPRKYENITRNIVRLNNTGKSFGLGYGAALATALFGQKANDYDGSFEKWIFGLSSIGSIALGEVGFHYQKKHNLSSGHIEMLRHYGVLGPWVGIAATLSTNTDNANAYGAAALTGGITGLLLGNNVATNNDYTKGDVKAISSLSLISTGLGMGVAIEILDNASSQTETNNRSSVFIIPGIASIAGTIIAQRQVKNLKLTRKQGSTLNLATAGAALVGFGLAVAIEANNFYPSALVYLGLPSGIALITHQLIIKKYKENNLLENLQSKYKKAKKWNLALNVNPENYFINQRLGRDENYIKTYGKSRHQSIVKLSLKF